jgi:hypothetical protein
LSSSQIGVVFDMHTRLQLDPARRAIDALDALRQAPLPAWPDQRVGAAFVTGCGAADVGERVGPHVADFNHVVAAVGVGGVQDDRLLPQIHEAETVNHVDVRCDVAGLFGNCRTCDVLHAPNFVRRYFGAGSDRGRVAQVIHGDDRGRVCGGLQRKTGEPSFSSGRIVLYSRFRAFLFCEGCGGRQNAGWQSAGRQHTGKNTAPAQAQTARVQVDHFSSPEFGFERLSFALGRECCSRVVGSGALGAGAERNFAPSAGY